MQGDNQHPENKNQRQGTGPGVPKKRALVMVALLLVVVATMYIGTFFKITQYGP